MIEIKFIPVILNNNAETTPNKEMTVMTGSNTLNDLLTAGGIFSPRFICKALTFDNSMNNSVAIIATITPANIAPVPVLLNERTPEMFTASFAPSGTTETILASSQLKKLMIALMLLTGFRNLCF